jgi:protein-L-isoaspartate(D-aspartate) O-methyltransferase
VGDVIYDFPAEREAMVERQLRDRGITEPNILDAFRAVPREQFVAAGYAHAAYGDYPLPIEAGQTISQPFIVALMIQAAAIKSGDKVLEVGSGSGYAAAVMGRIAAKVIGIERQYELVEIARERLPRFGYDNVEIVEGDGTTGWPAEAPYDAILAAASGSHVPRSLVEQLATAAQYGADLLIVLVDNAAYGTIRMHQEREYPGRISATELKNPDFAALARAYGAWAEMVETTEQFAPALDEALKRKGICLLHCKTDVEQISNATTITKLREKARK